MPSIITVFVADTPTTVDLIVTPSPSSPGSAPVLQELIVDESGASPVLELQPHGSGPLVCSTTVANQLSLQPGVYFFATDSQIKYDVTSGQCRVALQGGKNPTLPPPPAPMGTPLKKWESVYQSMYGDVVISANGTPAKQWIVVSIEEQSAS